MTTLLVILWVVSLTALTLIAAMRPNRVDRSMFELKRQNDTETLRREHRFGSIQAVLRFIGWLIAAFASMLAVAAWGGWGVPAMVAALLVAAALSRIGITTRLSARLYANMEPTLLSGIEKYPAIGKLLGDATKPRRDPKLESSEQLLHLVETSGHVLSDDQRNIITHGLAWHVTPVGQIMTKRRDIVSVKRRELLGPLVLDDLHKSGHNRFPVIGSSVDDIIGVLDITELLEVTGGRTSQTAEQAMSPRVLRIETDESLPAALAMLQKSHLHVLVVVDGDGKTAGLLTLADITGSLLGKTGVK